MPNALEAFRREFNKWALAYNVVKGTSAAPGEVRALLEAKIPQNVLRQIGAALLNGWLLTDFQLPTSFVHREESVEARLSHVGREDRGWL
jgi:hypothetical protein